MNKNSFFFNIYKQKLRNLKFFGTILAFLFGKEVDMQVQDISITQIVVVLLFLGALIVTTVTEK